MTIAAGKRLLSQQPPQAVGGVHTEQPTSALLGGGRPLRNGRAQVGGSSRTTKAYKLRSVVGCSCLSFGLGRRLGSVT